MHSQHIHTLSASEICKQSARESKQSYNSFSSCSVTKCLATFVVGLLYSTAVDVSPYSFECQYSWKLSSPVKATNERHLIMEVRGMTCEDIAWSLHDQDAIQSLKLCKHSFSRRVVQPWNALPQHVVDAPSTNAYKGRLDEHWEQ